jgi:pyruvate carboxylase
VFLKFAKNRASWGELDVLPTPQFFYGMEKGSEIMLEIEPGKTLVVKFLAVSEPHPDGSRTVFFELNGQPREVNVRDKTLQVTVAAREKADPAQAGQVGAPIPGVISSIAVEPGQKVAKGDRVLVMDAMKMQTTVYAPVAGKVGRVAVKVAQSVEPKDLLLVIE